MTRCWHCIQFLPAQLLFCGIESHVANGRVPVFPTLKGFDNEDDHDGDIHRRTHDDIDNFCDAVMLKSGLAAAKKDSTSSTMIDERSLFKSSHVEQNVDADLMRVLQLENALDELFSV